MMFQSDTHLNLAPPVDSRGRPLPPSQTQEAGGSFVTRTQILTALAVSLGSMIVGYSSAWSSPAIADMMEAGSGLEVTEQAASWIGSLMPMTALAGGIVGGPLLEAMGRKRTILATAIPFVAAGLIVTYATGWQPLVHFTNSNGLITETAKNFPPFW